MLSSASFKQIPIKTRKQIPSLPKQQSSSFSLHACLSSLPYLLVSYEIVNFDQCHNSSSESMIELGIL